MNNDMLLLNNYLLVLKSTVEVYVHGTLESSNEEVRNILKTGLDETLKHQSNVYDEMVCNDYYVVENINPSIIEKTLNTLNEEN